MPSKLINVFQGLHFSADSRIEKNCKQNLFIVASPHFRSKEYWHKHYIWIPKNKKTDRAKEQIEQIKIIITKLCAIKSLILRKNKAHNKTSFKK